MAFMNKNSLSAIGIVFLGLGIYMILAEYGLIFKIEFSWPIVLILIGAAMLIAFFNTKPEKDYLIWGNILLFIGIAITFIDNSSKFTIYEHQIFIYFIFVGLAVLASGLMSRDYRYLISYGIPLTAFGIFLNFYYFRKNINLRFWDTDFAVVGVICMLIGLKLVLDIWFGKRDTTAGS